MEKVKTNSNGVQKSTNKLEPVNELAQEAREAYQKYKPLTKANEATINSYFMIAVAAILGEFAINHHFATEVLKYKGIEGVLFAIGLCFIVLLSEKFFEQVFKGYLSNDKNFVFKVCIVSMFLLVIMTLITLGVTRYEAYVTYEAIGHAKKSRSEFEDKVQLLRNNDATAFEIQAILQQAEDKEKAIFRVIGVTSLEEALLTMLSSKWLLWLYVGISLLLGLLSAFFMGIAMVLHQILIQHQKIKENKMLMGTHKQRIRKLKEENNRAEKKAKTLEVLEQRKEEVTANRTKERARDTYQKAQAICATPNEFSYEVQDLKLEYFKRYLNETNE